MMDDRTGGPEIAENELRAGVTPPFSQGFDPLGLSRGRREYTILN